jgi:hypothetical protein
MSSFKEIGEATANAHVRIDQIRKEHANLQNEIMNDIVKLSEKIQGVALKFHEELDAIMNGEPIATAQEQDAA